MISGVRLPACEGHTALESDLSAGIGYQLLPVEHPGIVGIHQVFHAHSIDPVGQEHMIIAVDIEDAEHILRKLQIIGEHDAAFECRDGIGHLLRRHRGLQVQAPGHIPQILGEAQQDPLLIGHAHGGAAVNRDILIGLLQSVEADALGGHLGEDLHILSCIAQAGFFAQLLHISGSLPSGGQPHGLLPEKQPRRSGQEHRESQDQRHNDPHTALSARLFTSLAAGRTMLPAVLHGSATIGAVFHPRVPPLFSFMVSHQPSLRNYDLLRKSAENMDVSLAISGET